LRVFTEHVHFLYAMPPAAIILAEAVESLWLRLKALPNLVRVRRALACLLVLIGLDQALNIYGAYRVNHTAYRGIDDVADWFVRNVPKDSAVVTNVIHGEEIKWHSGNHIEVYWTQNTVSPINAASWTNRPRSRSCWRGTAPALCTFSTSISTTRRTRPTFTVISTSTRRRSPGATEGNSISRTSVRSLTCQNLPMLIFGRQSEAETRPLGGSGSGGRVFEGFGEQGRRKGY